jgi:hypothetical protein
MYFYQIPKKETNTSDTIIGVIDCSGSMENNWVWLANHWNEFIPQEKSQIITFDTKARIPAENRLNQSINHHGGGGTNITEGFIKLEEELAKLPNDSSVTVVFISDGEDNNQGTLEERMSKLKGNSGSTKRINFICIGVGSGFPTFISMRLREKYHNGDDTLPAIFLIEHVSEKAYTIKFEAIRPFLKSGQKVSIAPPVCVFPWREYSSEPFESSWIMTEADTLTLDGQKVDLRDNLMSFHGINEIFRSWNQMINLESMKEGEKVGARAKKTLSLMQSILDELKSSKGIDVFDTGNNTKFDSFLQKIAFKVNRRNFERIVWYFDDVKKIAEGNTVEKLSGFEAAKRIGLGTIVGRAAQKAFGLKNISQAEFTLIKDEFKTLLGKHPVEEKKDGTPLRQLLREKDLDKALDLCVNQLVLFDNMPFSGTPVRIVKGDNNQIDLERIDIRFVADNLTKELFEITEQEGGSLMVPVAEGKTEAVNSVVPLFSKDDVDLVPFIQSRLFKLHMSYNITKKPDTVIDQCMVYVLIGLFKHLISRKLENTDLLNKVLETYSLIKSTLPEGDFLTKPFAGTIASLVNETTEGTTPIRASNEKTLLNAFVRCKSKEISSKTARQLVRHLAAFEVHKTLTADKSKIKEAFNYKVKNDQKSDKQADLMAKMMALLPKVRSFGDLGKMISFQILAAELSSEIEVEFSPSKIEKVFPEESGIELFKKFLKLIGEEELTATDLEEIVLMHEAIANNPDLTQIDPNDLNANRLNLGPLFKLEINQLMKKEQPNSAGKGKKGQKGQKGKAPKGKGGEITLSEGGRALLTTKMRSNPLFVNCYPKLKDELMNLFKSIHDEVLPQDKAEMMSYCQVNGINFNSIRFCQESLLPMKSCGARNCYFYLKSMKRLDSHMAIWGSGLPKGFHLLVKKNRHLSPPEIFDVFSAAHFSEKGGVAVPFNPETYGRNKQQVVDYISKLKDAYHKILDKN